MVKLHKTTISFTQNILEAVANGSQQIMHETIKFTNLHIRIKGELSVTSAHYGNAGLVSKLVMH